MLNSKKWILYIECQNRYTKKLTKTSLPTLVQQIWILCFGLTSSSDPDPWDPQRESKRHLRKEPAMFSTCTLRQGFWSIRVSFFDQIWQVRASFKFLNPIPDNIITLPQPFLFFKDLNFALERKPTLNKNENYGSNFNQNCVRLQPFVKKHPTVST